MNEKNLGQKCSRCDGDMEKFKRGHHPICQKCQRGVQYIRNGARPKKEFDTSWDSWVCDCDEMYIYDKTIEMCIMGCCKEQPKQ